MRPLTMEDSGATRLDSGGEHLEGEVSKRGVIGNITRAADSSFADRIGQRYP